MSKLTTLLRYLNTPKRYHLEKKSQNSKQSSAETRQICAPEFKILSRIWQGYTDEEWRNFPIIDKAMMMENLQDLITVDLDITNARDLAERAEKSRDFSSKIGPYTIGFSSGTAVLRHAYCQ